MEDLGLDEPEIEQVRVSAKHIDGKAVHELDFDLILDLVRKREAYKKHIDDNLNVEMLWCMWKAEMRKLERPWVVFVWKVKPRAPYKYRRSWRWQGIPREDRPSNSIPLTTEGGREIYNRIYLSDQKLKYLQQSYYQAVEKAYKAGYSVTIMAKAIGINRSALRREIRRNMEWYGLAKVRHHTAKWIWE